MCYNLVMDKFTDFDSFGTPELLIMAGLGLALLLFGYRIKKIAFFIAWFILGYNLMAFLMPTMNNLVPQIADTELYQILLPICGGLLLAMLGFSIEKLCVGGIVFALTMVVAVRYFGSDVQVLAIGAVVGVILAAIAVMMIKPAIIVATSAVGAYALSVAILGLVPAIDFGAFYWPIMIGLTAIGSVFQFSTSKHVK